MKTIVKIFRLFGEGLLETFDDLFLYIMPTWMLLVHLYFYTDLFQQMQKNINMASPAFREQVNHLSIIPIFVLIFRVAWGLLLDARKERLDKQLQKG